MSNTKKLSIICFMIIFLPWTAMAGGDKKPIKAFTESSINSEDEVIDSDAGYVYQGVWQDSLNPFAIVPLRLSGFNRQCVVTSSSNHLEVMQFVGDSFQFISRIPFSIPNYDWGDYSWTTGDLNNDGSDEIIACHDSFVNRYIWNGENFLTQTAVFPYLIDQVRVGDINNDGDNEFVSFCGESLPHDGDEYPYHLCIAKWRDSRLNMLWDDSAKLGYGVSNMPDFLILIADVINTGYNQLLLSLSQSDVSPTEYNLLKWNDKKGSLELNKAFRISNQILPADAYYFMPYLTGEVNSITRNDTTFLAGIFESSGKEHMEDSYLLFEIKDDSLFQGRSIFHDYPGGTCFIDIDGKGIGVLVIWLEPPPSNNMFRFYRFWNK